MSRKSWITAIAGSCLCTIAQGQNNLGDGRGLENNDISVTRYNNRVNAGNRLLERIRVRNAVVTGNAPGGLSFRGDVGYIAPGEFRGELGANDLFAFRRDSLYSGLTGYGLRGTEAMQWQFALTTDAQAPRGLLGTPLVRRSGTAELNREGGLGNSLPGAADSDLSRPDPIESQIEAMRAPGGTLMGSLRSTSAYTVARPSTPTLLGSGQSDSGDRVGVTASPLQGIRLQELEYPVWMTGADGAPITPGADSRINPQGTGTQITPTRTAYDDVLERLRASTTPELLQGDPEKPAWQQRLDEIRDQLKLPGGMDDDESRILETGFSEEALQLIRDAGGMADTLIVGRSDPADPYANHVRQAQDLLSTGRYFDAEERFTRALSVRGGDVPAQIGRVHAQLGAGMYLSASINLRSLLGSNPEVTGVRYGQELLPTKSRVGQLIGVLRTNTTGGANSALRQESALLLAYIGAQTGDDSLTIEGLDLFEAGASPADRKLSGLLRGVWLAPPPPVNDPGR